MSPPVDAPFDNLAPWYDAIYAARGKDFAAEAASVLALIPAARDGRPPDSLLDVACGTGAHLAAFAASVPEVAGVDGHAGMLAVAAGRLPEGPAERRPQLVHAPMQDFDLGRRFDAVTCLFASIGYLPDENALGAAVRCMARHLAPGGVLVIEPPLTPDAVQPPQRQTTRCQRNGETLVRRSVARRHGDALEIVFRLRITSRAGTVRAREVHTIRLFTESALHAALRAAGLAADVAAAADALPPRLLIARRPPPSGQ